MSLNRSTRGAVALALLCATACDERPEAGDRCTALGGPVDCAELLIDCATIHGAPVQELCQDACQADLERRWICHGDQSPLTTGLTREADLPTRAAAVDYEVRDLDCALCTRWADAACVPDQPFCDPLSPTLVRRCAADGAGVRPTTDGDDCAPSGVCQQAGCPPEGPSTDTPCDEAARCGPRLCFPGSIECGDQEEVLVCSRHGERRRVIADCAGAGESLRCGPEPVCVAADAQTCDMRTGCAQGARCTAPGPQGGPSVCVPTASEGAACLGDLSVVCEQGLFCLVEYPDDDRSEPTRGVCRRACDLGLNDCGDGRACVPITAGAVCSETLDAAHREPCDTGLASPCDRGVVVAGKGECVPIVRPAEAEICNGIDDDCNGEIDDGPWDLQRDRANCGACGVVCGRGTTCEAGACQCPEGFVDLDGESINGCECPLSGAEICDGLDNDCDGGLDEDFDADGDGFPAIDDCATGAARDCDDGDPTVHPDAPEMCDGADQDCDDAIDETFDLASDVDHCGACQRSCRVPDARSACVQGMCPWECPLQEDGTRPAACAIECLPDTVDANDDMRDGCEETPCSAGLGAAALLVDAYPFRDDRPTALTWRERAAGVMAFAAVDGEEGAPDRLAVASWPGDAFELGPRRSTEALPVGPFWVTGLAWSPQGVGVLDGDAGRLLRVEEGALTALGEHALPADPDGAAWRGLAFDGSVWWAGLGERVFRLVSMDSPQVGFETAGPVTGLAADREARRLFTSEADRICQYRLDGVCAACWSPPEERISAGGIAWDGHELWLVDPEGSQVLQTRPDLP